MATIPRVKNNFTDYLYNMADTEIRSITNPELRVDLENRTVEGYAVVFDSLSEDLGFYETIHRGAITDDVINNSDVFARFNHDSEKILARSKKGKGSLKLTVDERGVKYAFKAPKTNLGNELLEYLERGDITASSFAFTIDPNDKDAEKWSNRDGKLYRDIYHINRLYDVAPVFSPAYEATTCSKRFDEIKATADEINGILNAIKSEIDSL